MSRLICSWLCCTVLCGCALDTRELKPRAGTGGEAGDSPSGDAGSGAGGRAASAGSGSSNGGAVARAGASSGGSGNSAGNGPELVDGCPDLDGNGVGDCSETLVENAAFASDVKSWAPGMDVTLEWDESNAFDDAPSGSARVSSTGVIDSNTPGAALRDVSQCLEVTGKQLVTVYANAFVEAGQDPNGHAEVDVFFFDAEACSGALSASFVTPQPLDAKTDTWLSLKAGAVSGEYTKSVLVKLGVSKPFSAPSFSARFDNVLVKIQAP